jgi:phage terminase large subunit-like protein
VRDAATAYARSVVEEKVPTGKLQRLACARHLRDLDGGHRRGLRFDVATANRAIGFFSFLKHSKGKWAGEAFALAPWQAFVVGSLFGWKRADGFRRFRTAYNEVPRKNGKSTLSAGLALLLAFFDGEPGAEVFCAATKRDQARIVFGEAKRMVQKTPSLKQRIRVFVSNLSVQETASKLEPLGADADTMDGLNPHGAVIDELHAHKNRSIVDVMETATGARRQPLQFEITTAGFDRHSVCWEHHDYSAKILEGILEDDSWFAFIASADAGDDWRDPRTWAKANPNLGASVSLEDLERKCRKAINVPAAQNAFRRLHLNEWTEQEERWLDMIVWDACAAIVDLDTLRGRIAFGGLDLANTRDITAFVLVFPDRGYDVLPFFWVPQEGVRERSRKDRVPYDVWVRDGLIEATPGNVTDYDVIRGRIKELAALYRIKEIAYDRWNATQLVTQLQEDGAALVPFGQGFASMSGPTKELEKLVLERKLRHGGNPVLRWMASNVTVRQDPAGNLKVDKAKSSEKVDGVVGLVMALGRATLDAGPTASIYTNRGVLVVGRTA